MYDVVDLKKEKVLFNFIKRITDIILSLVGILLFFMPTFIIIFLINKSKNDLGNTLFKQERIGKKGKKFYIYKFRSMVNNAEDILENDQKLLKKYKKNNFKLMPNEDPRVTSIGKVLRKTSIDEIPQFLNVFKGEMSIVGPRPVLENELKEYKQYKYKLLSVKPGITGYWQINGRSNIEYPERVEVELYYVDNKSILLDIKIIFLTFKKVLTKKGAY